VISKWAATANWLVEQFGPTAHTSYMNIFFFRGIKRICEELPGMKAMKITAAML